MIKINYIYTDEDKKKISKILEDIISYFKEKSSIMKDREKFYSDKIKYYTKEIEERKKVIKNIKSDTEKIFAKLD